MTESRKWTIEDYLITSGLSYEDVAGCEYCDFLINPYRDCNVILCANFKFQKGIYTDWRIWIRKMMKINNIGWDFLSSYLKMSEKNCMKFTSGSIPYFDKNKCKKLLKLFNATENDVNNNNVYKVNTFKFKIIRKIYG